MCFIKVLVLRIVGVEVFILNPDPAVDFLNALLNPVQVAQGIQHVVDLRLGFFVARVSCDMVCRGPASQPTA